MFHEHAHKLKFRFLPSHLLAALGALGMALMAYLAGIHFAPSSSSFCNFSAKFSCDLVNQSVYSEIAGLPISALGFLYFLTIAALPFTRLVKAPFRVVASFTVFSLIFGIYLSGVEYFVLRTFCLFCEISKLLMLGILALAIFECRRHGQKLYFTEIAPAAAAGLVMSFASYQLQSI